MTFGNGGAATALDFTAGGADEDVGVLGRITAIPEPRSIALIGLGLVHVGLGRRRAT